VPPDPLSQSLLVFTVDVLLPRSGDRRFGQNDDVQIGRRVSLVAPERLSQESLDPVSGHRTSNPPAHGQAEPIGAKVRLDGDQGEEPSVQASATSQDPPVVRRRDDSFLASQGRSRTGAHRLRPRGAFDPSAGAASTRDAPPCFASARESHGSFSAFGCWVETSVSSRASPSRDKAASVLIAVLSCQTNRDRAPNPSLFVATGL
jgi:hypothetical protein